MGFDISGLQLRDLPAEERVDFTKPYVVAGDYQPPPVEGIYLLQTKELKPAKHPQGILAADLVAVVVSDDKGNKDGAGYKVYENGGIFNIKLNKFRNASNVDDYLRAHGIVFDAPPDNPTYAQALGVTQDKIAKAQLVWDGYCKDCDANIKGMDQWPIGPDGKRLFRRPCPTCKKDVFARASIKRWVSAVAADQKG